MYQPNVIFPRIIKAKVYDISKISYEINTIGLPYFGF